MIKRVRRVASLVGSGCLLFLLLCSEPAAAQPHVTARRGSGKQTPYNFKIGVILPLTGERAAIALELLIGLEFAIRPTDEFAIKPAARPTLLYEDDGCDPQRAERAYATLVDRARVHVVLGPVCAESINSVKKLAELRRVPILPLVFADAIQRQSDQVYAFSYDFREEAALLISELSGYKSLQLAAVGTGEEERGVYREVLDALATRGAAITELRLAGSTPEQIHTFIATVRKFSAGAGEIRLIVSAEAMNRYPGVVRQLERLQVPIVRESGVALAGDALHQPLPAKGIAAQPQIVGSHETVAALAAFATAQYRQPVQNLFLPLVGYEALKLLLDAVHAGTLDVHESLRLYDGKPTALPFVPLKKRHSYLFRPKLVTAQAQ